MRMCMPSLQIIWHPCIWKKDLLSIRRHGRIVIIPTPGLSDASDIPMSMEIRAAHRLLAVHHHDRLGKCYLLAYLSDPALLFVKFSHRLPKFPSHSGIANAQWEGNTFIVQ